MKREIAIINGASGGIGSSIAENLANRYDLILLGRDESKLTDLVIKLKNKVGVSAEYHLVNFENLGRIKETIEKIKNHKEHIKALINSVGIVPVGTIEEVNEDNWEQAIQVCLINTIRLVKYFSEFMPINSSIVLINGVFAIQPASDFIITSTITGAIRNFAKAASKDLIKKGIRVNSVLPGATKTPLWDKIANTISEKINISADEITQNVANENPMKRIASPKDVANAVAFLISNDAAYINGASILVDGGASTPC